MSNDAQKFEQLGQLVLELGWVGNDQLSEALRKSRTMGIPLGLALISLKFLRRNELNALIEAQSLVRDQALNPILAMMALTLVGWSAVSLQTALMFLGIKKAEIDATPNRLGLLLLEANCVNHDQMSAALACSQATGLPVGQTLLLKQMITGSCLKMALEAQELVRKGVLTQEEAVRSLRLTFSHGSSKSSERMTLPLLPELRLGELLVLAEVVSRDDVKQALEVAQANKRRLGEILSIYAVLPASILTAALELQRLMRRGELTIDESITALGLAYRKGVPISDAVANARRTRVNAPKSLSVAHFLKLVGVLTDKDLNLLIESTLDNSKLLSQLLAGEQRVDPAALKAAARLKYLVKSSVLTLDAACFAFNHCMEMNKDVDQFLAESGWLRPVEGENNLFVSMNGHVTVVV